MRNQKLRLNRLIDNIITKDFDVDPALQNQAKTRAHHEKIFAIKADQSRIIRALEDLKHSQEEYAETIDRIQEEEHLAKEEDAFAKFLDTEDIAGAETAGKDCLDQLETKGLEHKGNLEFLNSTQIDDRVPSRAMSTPVPQYGFQSRMPKLSPRKFAGKIIKWNGFWQNFITTVDEKPYTDKEKMAYLLDALEGPALNAVKGFDISEENYPIVTKILEERFG